MDQRTNSLLLKELESHSMWLKDATKGHWANLDWLNLSNAHLEGVNLMKASLRHTNLQGANLCSCNLKYADLLDTDMRGAQLVAADLSYANFYRANLSGANMQHATCVLTDFHGAIFDSTLVKGADFKGANLKHTMHIPESLIADFQLFPIGSVRGWKRCLNGVVVELEVDPDTPRVNTTSGSFRAARVHVIETYPHGSVGISAYDHSTRYIKGETVVADSFDPNPLCEETHGIHFRLTRDSV